MSHSFKSEFPVKHVPECNSKCHGDTHYLIGIDSSTEYRGDVNDIVRVPGRAEQSRSLPVPYVRRLSPKLERQVRHRPAS